MPDENIPTPHFLSKDLAGKYETLLKVSHQAEPDLRQIAQLVQDVPILKRRILSVANGASHGLRRRVTSTQQAVSLLGADRIREIAQLILIENRHVGPPPPRGTTALP